MPIGVLVICVVYCLSVTVFVHKFFVTDTCRVGDAFRHYGRPGWVAGHLPLLVNFGLASSP